MDVQKRLSWQYFWTFFGVFNSAKPLVTVTALMPVGKRWRLEVLHFCVPRVPLMRMVLICKTIFRFWQQCLIFCLSFKSWKVNENSRHQWGGLSRHSREVSMKPYDHERCELIRIQQRGMEHEDFLRGSTTLAKKKNHPRDSRQEERCSTCDIMLDQARSAQGKSRGQSRIGLALRWSRLIEHDITRGTAFFSSRISIKEDYSTTRWCRTREVGHVNKHWQCTTHRLCNCLTATVMEVDKWWMPVAVTWKMLNGNESGLGHCKQERWNTFPSP